MNALKHAVRVKGPMLRSASRHSPYSCAMPEFRRRMDGQSIRCDNNCSALRRRAQLETNLESSQLMLGDFDQKFYRPRYIHDRKFQRTWAELEEHPQPADETDVKIPKQSSEQARREPWVQGQRYDEVKYDPKPLMERTVQRTWQEEDTKDEAEEWTYVAPKRSACERLEQQRKPVKRISKQRMSASSYMGQVISNQDDNMERSYECGLQGSRRDIRRKMY